MKHVPVRPYEVYEMMMEVNKAQMQGRWRIRIGTAGEKDLLDAERHDKHDRKHRGPNEQGSGPSSDEE